LGASCGDGTCTTATESCSTCPGDCGGCTIAGLNNIDVLYFQDFEDDALGYYQRADLDEDFPDNFIDYRWDKCQIVNDYTNGKVTKFIRLNYPAGIYGIPTVTGANFRMFLGPFEDHLGLPGFDESTYGKEMYMSYDIKFSPGFEWRLEGKFNSLLGGKWWYQDDPANGTNWFYSGAVWKDNGIPAFYLYYPDEPYPDGSTSFQWGNPDNSWLSMTKVEYAYNNNGQPFFMEDHNKEQTHNLTFRVVMNTVNANGTGNYDGIVEGFFDGVLISQIKNVLFRTTEDLYINLLSFGSHMGGLLPQYAPSQDQYLEMDNVILYKFKSGIPGIPYGNNLSSVGRTVPIFRSIVTNFCGDGTCTTATESCSTCPGDCGGCANPPCVPESSSTTCSGKCGTQTNNCGQSVSCGSCSAANGQINSLNDLNIVFKHDFERNTLGNYRDDEWREDFRNPEWGERSTLNIIQDTTDSSDSTKALQMNFQEGTRGGGEGSMVWWTTLNGKYEELYFSYDVMFEPGFDFGEGAKIPSLKGGNAEVEGQMDRPDGYDGFANGLMFKEYGRIVFYLYFPDSRLDMYGDSYWWGGDYADDVDFSPSTIEVGYTSRGLATCTAGEWHNLTYRTVLNTIDANGNSNYDGILEAYFDGKLVFQLTHILWRRTKDLGIDTLNMRAFFGGTWTCPKDEWMRMDNVIVYTIKDNINVPRGNVLSPTNRTINYWRNFTQ